MAELLIEEITKQYPTRGEPLVVLRGVSLRVTTGENVAILGPSGCGKSTLLHILGTLDQPSSGRVLLDGCDASRLAEPDLADFRNRQIGFVFQDHHLLPQCSVLENVLLPAVATGAVSDEAIAARGCWSIAWGSRCAAIIGRPSFPGANANERPSPGRCSIGRSCCWPTSRRAISIAPRRSASPNCWSNWSSKSRRCWWW